MRVPLKAALAIVRNDCLKHAMGVLRLYSPAYVVSISLLLIGEGFEMRLDLQAHDSWRTVCKVLLLSFRVHRGIYVDLGSPRERCHE